MLRRPLRDQDCACRASIDDHESLLVHTRLSGSEPFLPPQAWRWLVATNEIGVLRDCVDEECPPQDVTIISVICYYYEKWEIAGSVGTKFFHTKAIVESIGEPSVVRVVILTISSRRSIIVSSWCSLISSVGHSGKARRDNVPKD